MVKAIPDRSYFILLLVVILFLVGCSRTDKKAIAPTFTQESQPANPSTPIPSTKDTKATSTSEENDENGTTKEEQVNGEKPFTADVVSVSVNGSAHEFQFSVEISSPDTGCEQYADWWEVLSEDGELIYRRILGHSHVNEQPFTRSGGPVSVTSNTVVIIRAHMNQAGYGGIIMKGSINSGFIIVDLPVDFALEVENKSPLPSGCNF